MKQELKIAIELMVIKSVNPRQGKLSWHGVYYLDMVFFVENLCKEQKK